MPRAYPHKSRQWYWRLQCRSIFIRTFAHWLENLPFVSGLETKVRSRRPNILLTKNIGVILILFLGNLVTVLIPKTIVAIGGRGPVTDPRMRGRREPAIQGFPPSLILKLRELLRVGMIFSQKKIFIMIKVAQQKWSQLRSRDCRNHRMVGSDDSEVKIVKTQVEKKYDEHHNNWRGWFIIN